MQIEGLIPFKSSTDQAMASLYFLIILISFYSFSFVKPVAMITRCALSAPKKAYFKCLGNSFRNNPSELFSTSFPSSSFLLDYFALISFRLSTVSLNSKLEFRYSTSRASIYWKFISFSFI